MERSRDDEYREWLGERIEGLAGSLNGGLQGIWSLDTVSLEKLYIALVTGSIGEYESDPRVAFKLYRRG